MPTKPHKICCILRVMLTSQSITDLALYITIDYITVRSPIYSLISCVYQSYSFVSFSRYRSRFLLVWSCCSSKVRWNRTITVLLYIFRQILNTYTIKDRFVNAVVMVIAFDNVTASYYRAAFILPQYFLFFFVIWIRTRRIVEIDGSIILNRTKIVLENTEFVCEEDDRTKHKW
jgi:hypothetical protein